MFSRWLRHTQFAQRHNLVPLIAEIQEKAGVILQAGCIVYVFREYCLEISVVSLSLPIRIHLARRDQPLSNNICPWVQCMGPSMLPTFNTKGDILLLEHFSTLFDRIEIGERQNDAKTASHPDAQYWPANRRFYIRPCIPCTLSDIQHLQKA